MCFYLHKLDDVAHWEPARAVHQFSIRVLWQKFGAEDYQSAQVFNDSTID